MLALLFIIAIVGGVICATVSWKKIEHGEYGDAEDWFMFAGLVCFLAFIMLVAFFIVLACYVGDSYADERIEVVKTKNTEIEKEIQVAVKSYLEHEGKTYTDMTSDEALAVAVAYPELASNELVKEQIATYKSNREQVLQYEQQKIDKKIKAWWLWLGSE
jgi:hypothetical protein